MPSLPGRIRQLRANAFSYTLRRTQDADRAAPCADRLGYAGYTVARGQGSAADALPVLETFVVTVVLRESATPRLPFRRVPREPREISGLARSLELRVEFPAQCVQRGITEFSNEGRETAKRQPGQFREQRPGRSQPIRAIASVCHPHQRMLECAASIGSV